MYFSDAKNKPTRGEQLQERILWAAKDVFLEMGFERASMDLVAQRAETSKRTLYARFECKENLFLAVIEYVRGLMMRRLSSLDPQSEKPAAALTEFCVRYVQAIVHTGAIRLCRVSVSEADRYPEQAKQCFYVLFAQVQSMLSAHLTRLFGLSVRASAEAAQRLLAQVLYPVFLRGLFGVDSLVESLDEFLPPSNPDLKPIRRAVAELLESIAGH